MGGVADNEMAYIVPGNQSLSLSAEDLLDVKAGNHSIVMQIRNPISSGTYFSNFAGGDTHLLNVLSVYEKTEAFLSDAYQTYLSGTQLFDGLVTHREITVPSTGAHDFARTVEVLENPTGSDIATTVRIVGNLGSDTDTMVFNTSDGDTVVEVTDQWIGTDDADGAGSPAIVHYVHGPYGLSPSSVQVIDDNIVWEYDVTVPAGETVRLMTLTILANTRSAAETATAELVTENHFAGMAAEFLSPAELVTIANFEYFDFGDAPHHSVILHDDGGQSPNEIAPAPYDPSIFGLQPQYATLLVHDGARHGIVSGATILGAVIDAEPDGQPTAWADGDDVLDGTDDEDGVIAATPLVVGQSASMTIVASAPGKLDAWLDLSGNGVFDHPTDHLSGGTSLDVVACPNVLDFSIPATAVPGTSFARLRISSVGGLLPTGLASDGEVEDYAVTILPSVDLSVDTNLGSEAAGTVITVTATSSVRVVGNQTVDVAVTGTGITAGDYSLSDDDPGTAGIQNSDSGRSHQRQRNLHRPE